MKKFLYAALLGLSGLSFASNTISFNGDNHGPYPLYYKNGSPYTLNTTLNTSDQSYLGTQEGKYRVYGSSYPPSSLIPSNLFVIDGAGVNNANPIFLHFYRLKGKKYYIFDDALFLWLGSQKTGTLLTVPGTPNVTDLRSELTSWTSSDRYSWGDPTTDSNSVLPALLKLTNGTNSPTTAQILSYRTGLATDIVSPFAMQFVPKKKEIKLMLNNYGVTQTYSQSFGQKLQNIFTGLNLPSNYWVSFENFALAVSKDTNAFFPCINGIKSSTSVVRGTIGAPTSADSDFSVITTQDPLQFLTSGMPVKHGLKTPSDTPLDSSLTNSQTFPLPAFASPYFFPYDATCSIPGLTPEPIHSTDAGNAMGIVQPGNSLKCPISDMDKLFIWTVSGNGVNAPNNYKSGASIVFYGIISTSEKTLNTAFSDIVLHVTL